MIQTLAPLHVESVRAALIDHLSREEFLSYGDLMRRVVRAVRASDEQATDAV